MHLLRTSLLLAFLGACTGPSNGVPSVQDSADAKAKTFVSINRIAGGKYRAIAPICLGQRYVIDQEARTVEKASGLPIRPGDTIEFRNYLPEGPTNVTSFDAPTTMFSPNLVEPYNFVQKGDESYSFWRFTFSKPGVYEYFDTNMGEPGRKVVDSYYGTTTFIGESTAPKGAVCVDAPGCTASLDCLAGNGTNCCSCPGVCCDVDENCAPGKSCLRNRCVDPSSVE